MPSSFFPAALAGMPSPVASAIGRNARRAAVE